MSGSKSKCHCEDYVVVNRHGAHEKTLCKLCGAVLASLVPTDKGQWSEKKGNQTIVYQPTVMAPTNSYAVIEILFKDGSRHQTPICKECANKKLATEQLEALHDADCRRFKQIGMKVDRIEKREPIGYRIVE